MSNLLTHDPNALRLLMTEDLYILPQQEKAAEIIPERQEADPIQKPAEMVKSKEFSYIGENNKYFLILFDDHTRKEISSQDKETLLKIMSAKGLELRDLAILNIAQYPGLQFSELKDFFSCSRAALFGIDPKRIELPAIGANRVEKHMDVRVLPTFSLEEMNTDIAKKREFWNVMKGF